ncbi:MAG: ATP-binding cassette domain-containing protein [Lachnospiraceae bacterium]|nr:ATP-binding cassette domain-containing protein [Lachnospiraceae bacterium]
MYLKLSHVQKAYSGKEVLKDYSFCFSSPKTYCIMGPSGCGKTTLFHLICGLEKPDAGSVESSPEKLRFSVVFQEDRLLESLDALKNIQLVTPKEVTGEQILAHLSRILPPESLSQPLREFSGGMKRRVAICRALLAASDVVLMDEPFNGLDPDSRDTTAAYIRDMTRDKIVLFSTHQESDADLLDATICTL